MIPVGASAPTWIWCRRHGGGLTLRSLYRMLCFVSLMNHRAEVSCLSSPPMKRGGAQTLKDRSEPAPAPARFALLGGTGRIGTAAADHILRRRPASEIVLVGRREGAGRTAVAEVLERHPTATVSFVRSDNLWTTSGADDARDGDRVQVQRLLNSCDCVIHTAGPYPAEGDPLPLRQAIDSPSCKVFVDVSDPLPFLERSLLLCDRAASSGTTALLSAGAFPGLSNVLAAEAIAAATGETDPADAGPTEGDRLLLRDVDFYYFTAGLGGSGDVNLYITNLGFGEDIPAYEGGSLRFFPALSGSLLGAVDFFLPADAVVGDCHDPAGNAMARERVGTRQVFAWPFPEAATVARRHTARGNSISAMGTAPDVWNVMLQLLVDLVPRQWWRNASFSKFMADFSRPLVWLTDMWLKREDSAAGTGETHAMRIDVTAAGDNDSNDGNVAAYSVIQAHDSFRQCVGQSCAEFALDCLEHYDPNKGGVYLPEQLYCDPAARRRIISRLTTTPGTFCYTGPVKLKGISKATNLERAIRRSKERAGT